jgi:hypothetical protein
LIGLRASEGEFQPIGPFFDVADVEPYELGASKCGGEPDEQERPIAPACRIVAAGRDEFAQILGDDGTNLVTSNAMGATDAGVDESDPLVGG